MRKLTFKGFLSSYTRALAGVDTDSLARLAQKAMKQPRVVEPLLLFAVVSGRTETLRPRLAARPDLDGELDHLDRLADTGTLEAELDSPNPSVRAEYAKVWRSYVARRDAPQRDARLKLEVRDRLLALEREKHVTRYRMAKDLGLNPGNLHAYLALGQPDKLSLDRAFELLDYVQAA